MSNIYYPSKRDFSLGIILLGITIPLFFYSFLIDSSYLIKSIDLLIILLVIWFFFDTGYTLTSDNKIKIKAGPIRGKVEIEKIIKIKATRSILSSAALSFNRLQITSNSNLWNAFWMISPKRKKEFIDELRKRNPQIDFDI